MKKRFLGILCILLLVVLTAAAEPLNYSEETLWAYTGTAEQHAADVFFIAPTNVMGSADYLTADLGIEEDRTSIKNSIGMQTGIYNTCADFYAPFYRQMTMAGYKLSESERAPYLAIAEEDVLAAFSWYFENWNNGKPFILAGFSQGADMALRLLKAYSADEAFQSRLIGAYLIGWPVTEDDLASCPALKMAQGETDTGVIIAFECEDASVTDTLIVPADTFTYSINPLNWKTDSTYAGKELNLGCVFPAADGSVVQEIPQLCGAWIDPIRGTLKVSDVDPKDYPSRLAILPEGSYHIYDYLFFYRNLQKNVEDRIGAFLALTQPD